MFQHQTLVGQERANESNTAAIFILKRCGCEWVGVCVCLCVCVSERERERTATKNPHVERIKGENFHFLCQVEIACSWDWRVLIYFII